MAAGCCRGCDESKATMRPLSAVPPAATVPVTIVSTVTSAAESRTGGDSRDLIDAPPAVVRAALVPEDAERFDEQWRAAMAAATNSLDLGPVQAIRTRQVRATWPGTYCSFNPVETTGRCGDILVKTCHLALLRCGSRSDGAMQHNGARAHRQKASYCQKLTCDCCAKLTDFM